MGSVSEIGSPHPSAPSRALGQPSAEEAIAAGASDLAALVRRGGWLIAACALGATLLAAAYLALTPPLYRATASLLVDPGALQVVGKDIVRSDTAASIDLANIESQGLVIVSNAVLDQTVDEMKLEQDPAFRGGGLLSRLVGDGGASRAKVVENLRRAIVTRRVDASLVFEITVSHPDPETAAAIANRLAAVYLRQGAEGRGAAVRRANETLFGQLAALRRQLSDADMATERFRSENGLVSTGEAGLLVNQQLKDITSEITLAETDLARVAARRDQLAKVGPDALLSDRIPEAITSPAMAALRAQYGAAAREAARMAETLLPRHPRLMEARGELSAARKSLAEELERVRGSVAQEFDQATAKLAKLRERVGSLTRSQAASSQSEIRLRQLESEAAAIRSVYDASLARAKELEQQATIDTSNSRLISDAAVPIRPARAPALVVLPAALLFGACLGLAVAFLRDLTRGAVPSARAAAEMFGVAGFADLRLASGGRVDDRDRGQVIAVARRLQRRVAGTEPAIVVAAYGPGLDPAAAWAATKAIGRALSELGAGGWVCRQQEAGAPMHVERMAPPRAEPLPAPAPGRASALAREAAALLHARDAGGSETTDYLLLCDDDPLRLANSAASADAVLLLFEAGRTPRRALRETLETLDPSSDRLVAVVSVRRAPAEGLARWVRWPGRARKAWA